MYVLAFSDLHLDKKNWNLELAAYLGFIISCVVPPLALASSLFAILCKIFTPNEMAEILLVFFKEKEKAAT